MGFYDPGETFDTAYGDIPEGEYPAVLNSWNWKATKATDDTGKPRGHYLELEFIIVDHILMNRKHWERLNLDNPNEKAVGIARELLNKFLKALPWTDPIGNEEELFKAMGDIQGKKINMVIKHRQKQDGEKEVQIKNFKEYERPSNSPPSDEIPF
jgi:hypothetical protein